MKADTVFAKTLRNNLVRALRRGQLSDAEILLNKLKAIAPFDRATRILELELLIKNKSYQEIANLKDSLVQLYPDSSRLFFLLGQAEYLQKEYKQAEVYLREALRLGHHTLIQNWLGKTLTQLGQYDEAQHLLEQVVAHDASALQNLAWLFERKGDVNKAILYHEKYLALKPANNFSKNQIIQLKARNLDSEDVIDELDAHETLNEEIPLNVLPAFVERLLQGGYLDRVRQIISARHTELKSTTGIRIGWICYKNDIYDLAYDLFLLNIQNEKNDYKMLNSLDKAAEKCLRIHELIQHYTLLAPQIKNLYGHIRRLQKRLPATEQ